MLDRIRDIMLGWCAVTYVGVAGLADAYYANWHRTAELLLQLLAIVVAFIIGMKRGRNHK